METTSYSNYPYEEKEKIDNQKEKENKLEEEPDWEKFKGKEEEINEEEDI